MNGSGFEFVEGLGYEHPSASPATSAGESYREAPPPAPRMPTTWAEVYSRLAFVVGSDAAAHEWLEEAVTARFGGKPSAISQSSRALALQKAIGALYALEEIGCDGMLPFDPAVRSKVADVFARYFDGAALDGPPWKLAPDEAFEPPATSDFDDVA